MKANEAKARNQFPQNIKPTQRNTNETQKYIIVSCLYFYTRVVIGDEKSPTFVIGKKTIKNFTWKFLMENPRESTMANSKTVCPNDSESMIDIVKIPMANTKGDLPQ